MNSLLVTTAAVSGNYRFSITDATQAKKLKPDHIKAILRGTGIRYTLYLEWNGDTDNSTHTCNYTRAQAVLYICMLTALVVTRCDIQDERCYCAKWEQLHVST